MQFEAKEIGDRIAQARNEAGLTQEEFAEMASFSKRSLQDYEAGVTIPYKHMREISRILKKPVEWLLHGEPDADEQVPGELEDVIERTVVRVLHQVQFPRLGSIEERVASVERATAGIHDTLGDLLETVQGNTDRLAAVMRLLGEQVPESAPRARRRQQ